MLLCLTPTFQDDIFLSNMQRKNIKLISGEGGDYLNSGRDGAVRSLNVS